MTTLPISTPVAVVALAALLATAGDLRSFRIRNALTLSLVASGLLYHAVDGGWAGLGASLLGACFGLGILLSPYIAGAMGGGDVKLMAGVGAWLGMPLAFEVLLAAAIASGVYALVLAVACGRVAQTYAGVVKLMAAGKIAPEDRVAATLAGPERRRRLVPFAAMLALGLIVAAVRNAP